MKHTFTLLIVLTLSNSMHSYAQSLPSNNAYRDGDRVRKQLIEYKNLGRSGENVLWDLGEVEVKDSRYTVAYRNVDTDREQINATANNNTEETVTDYCGSFIYQNGILDKVLFDGGYITYNGSTPTFHFYIQDHLGNNRAVVNHSGTLEQETHYYPFGAINGALSTNPEFQPYKFTGKELDRTNGYDMMDYGARMYAADLGRWMVMDPLAEKYYDISPYAYCGNNPVNAVDPDGRKIFIIGNRQERISVLRQLQKLTNDKLGVRRRDGSVIIMSRGTRNMNKKLSSGTNLISALISHERNMNITPNEEFNKEHDIYRMDALNGKGTDVEVKYILKSNPLLLTRNPQTGEIKKDAAPSHIVLGHELIHGHRSMNGVAISGDLEDYYSYKDENGEKRNAQEKTEELETVGIKGSYIYTENKLRKEHDLNKRIKY